MNIPWQELAPETLHNLVTEFVLRQGTDYGLQEVSIDQKVAQVMQQLKEGNVVIVFSELHETVDIKHKDQLSEKD